jgi:hypothetical protein
VHKTTQQTGERYDALSIIGQYEGKRPPSLDLFLDFVGLTEDEFNEIVQSHRVSPWDGDEVPVQLGSKTHDFDRWSRHGKMPREEAAAELQRWHARIKNVSASVGN